MNTLEISNSYSEVMAILNKVCIEDYNKIPKDIIETIKSNLNPSYSFKYDPSKTLDEQNVSKDAKTVIAILFRDYWANPTQKEKILAKEEYDNLLEEQEKQKKYGYDNLFNRHQKNDNITEEDGNVTKENIALVEVKTHWYSKILNKILKIFRR